MESKKSSKLMNYQKRLKKLLNKELKDIIIFGSFVKSGSPNDIDIALLVTGKDVLNLKKEIKEIIGKKADIEIVDIDSVYSPIWLTLIKEGFSVKKNAFLSDLYKIKPVVLFKYSLKRLNNVQKVQFNRGIKNVLGKEGEILTRSVVVVPMKLKNAFSDFLKTWNIYYESREYELLPLLRKEELV